MPGHLRLALLGAVAILALPLVISRPSVARAAGSGGGNPLGVADGLSASFAWYLGTTASPADNLGDRIEFSVAAASGSGATPRLRGGGTTQVIPLSGGPCDGAPATGFPRKCVALANVLSPTPGIVNWTARNLDSGGPSVAGTVRFLPWRAVIPAQRDLPGESSAVYVQNLGTAATDVAIAWLTDQGQGQGTIDRRGVLPGGMRGFDFATFEGAEAKMVVHVGSDEPVATLWEFTRHLPDGRIAYGQSRGFAAVQGVTGSATVLPYIANQLEGAYNTSFSIANNGTTLACATITYTFVPGAGSVPSGGRLPHVDRGPGGSGCSVGYPIPPGGQRTFSPTGQRFTTPMPVATQDALMAATVDVTGGSVVVAVEAYTADGTAKAAAYDGFLVGGSGSGIPPSDLGTRISIPLALKTSDGYYTQILLANPNASAATVTIAYSGNTGTHTVALDIPAHGVANHSVYSDNVVPLGFVGAATVTSSSPIAAVLFRSKKVSPGSDLDEDIYTAVNGIPASRGATTLYLPQISRRFGKTASHEGLNTWVSVSVPGGGAANVTLRSIGSCSSAGNIYSESKRVTGSFIFYQNLDSENGLGDTPPCFIGATTITSDVPVVAVTGVVCDCEGFVGELESVYNAVTP